MNTPLPFGQPQRIPPPTVKTDAVDEMKKHAKSVLDLMELPLTFDEEWHADVKRAVAGQIQAMLHLLEDTHAKMGLAEAVSNPHAKA